MFYPKLRLSANKADAQQSTQQLASAEVRFKDEKVAKLLQELQMQMYLPRFEEHEIDMDVLLDVTDEDLIKLGVDKLGHRRKLLTHIDKCKTQYLKLERQVGNGVLGSAFIGKMKKHTTVFVKEINDIDQPAFLKHVGSISAISGHPHIVKLVGAVREETQPTTLYLITEYVPDGSVHRFLQENGSQLHFRVLLEICKNAAAGMDHLHERGVIHGSLAVKNLMIERLHTYNVVKVAGYGIMRAYETSSRNAEAHNKRYHRWQSPEVLAGQGRTYKSDIWSFGIVLWEIFSFGRRPYDKKSDDDVRAHVLSGARLACPPNCPQQIYDLILRCWDVDPNKRPTSFDIGKKLLAIASMLNGYSSSGHLNGDSSSESEEDEDDDYDEENKTVYTGLDLEEPNEPSIRKHKDDDMATY